MELGLGYNQPVRLRKLQLLLPTLPEALSPLKVLHFSDIHLGGRETQDEKLLELIESVPADMVVFTGDALYGYASSGSFALDFFTRLARRVEPRYGMHLVRGNHDNRPAIRSLINTGISVLLNSSLLMHDGSPPWHLIGVDDPRWACDDLARALQDVPSDAFKLLLAHSPDILPDAAQHGIDLVLCGHTHGGQIRLPWLGALVTRTKISRRYAWGLQTYDGTISFTTCGAGCSFPPIRLDCPQEIVLLELVRG